ncbi:methyltransferase domain-containing protein [Nonlabens xiamenensis]|uniref:methyltransferase domain-containing protein n=1 Tax=Nonlabens xiamenensis TaxID=2341043 RepID=UPI000F60477C|nr:methyltransferase domain-containing protein [Nonlabens xiamenensis]
MSYRKDLRSKEEEWMDHPGINPRELQAAVDDINTINSLLQGFKFTLNAVKELLAQYPKVPLHIVDVGCGDGAMLRYLHQHLDDERLSFTGLDIAAASIEQARRMSPRDARLRFRESDIHQLREEHLGCDIMISSLTMHHFDEEQILSFLAQFKRLTSKAIIINDLHRHAVAYYLFKYLSPIFIRNEISRHDGLVSIASGFKKADFKRYADFLNCTTDRLTWKWSFRYIWIIPIDGCKD